MALKRKLEEVVQESSQGEGKQFFGGLMMNKGWLGEEITTSYSQEVINKLLLDLADMIKKSISSGLPQSDVKNYTRAIPSKASLKMVAGSLYLPKDNKLKPQGEDDHFICVEEQTFGVADGVGGWTEKGLDAGEYARDLMSNSIVAVHNQPKGAVDPKAVLCEAYSNTKAEGSSTACVITLTGHILHAVNVGDSGFMLVRGGKVIYQSPVQQHFFNCPYQLGNSNDHPSLAQELEVEVEPEDIVVAGTDGLLDNMHAREVEELINRGIQQGEDPQQLACSIANLALYNSFDRSADTPFAQAANKAGYSHTGGKVDDITVIVAFLIHS